MKKLTKKHKETLAFEILELLKQHDLTGDVRIYFNDKCLTGAGTVLENMKGSGYFKYATDKTISMSFEGDLCDVLNYHHGKFSAKVISELQAVLSRYGLFYELGEHWNLGTYYIDGEPAKDTKTAVEGESPENPIYIRKNACPAELEPIRAEWEKRQNEHGDAGSCVLGAGFTFRFKKRYYKMRPQGRWQGSISWEDSVETIRHMLFDAGCEEIQYNCGNMD